MMWQYGNIQKPMLCSLIYDYVAGEHLKRHILHRKKGFSNAKDAARKRSYASKSTHILTHVQGWLGVLDFFFFFFLTQDAAWKAPGS